MDIEKTLQQFGLNEKEIKIYLSLLQLGRATVLIIAKKAGVKRPTAYLILEDLVKKGLAAKIPKKGKTAFQAENPEKLTQILEKRKQDIQTIIPNLLGIYNIKTDKPQILLYEGQEGIKYVYNMIYQEAKELWWFSNLEKVNQKNPWIVELSYELAKNNKIVLRDFIGSSDWEIKYARRQRGKNYEIKHNLQPIDLDFALFNDKAVILSLDENIYAVVIQDQRIVNSFKTLYELAWKSGKKTLELKKGK